MKLYNIFFVIVSFILFFNSQDVCSQNDIIKNSGDVLLFSLPAMSLTKTLIDKDGKGTWQFAKGLVTNQIITFGLKKLIRRERPNKQNFDSFPSGHTSTVFQSASFLQQRYGWGYGIPAYILASYTGYTRIHAKKHHFTDVLAGAIIGVLSSYIYTSRQQKGDGITINVNGGINDMVLIGFRYKL